MQLNAVAGGSHTYEVLLRVIANLTVSCDLYIHVTILCESTKQYAGDLSVGSTHGPTSCHCSNILLLQNHGTHAHARAESGTKLTVTII